MQELLDFGADIDSTRKYAYFGEMTALMKATQKENYQVVKFLIDNGADVNYRNEYGFTALMMYPTLNVAKLLVENGADVNARTNTCWTPLMYVTLERFNPTAMYLIEKGANVNARTNDNHTVLIEATWRCNPQLVSTLILKGADVNVRTNKGWTALKWATSDNFSCSAAVPILKAAGAVR